MAPRRKAETAKKRAATPEFSSLASRKRRRPSCSVASLAALEDEETLESKFVALFEKPSHSHLTWGKSSSSPIVATKRKGKCKQRHVFNTGKRMAFLFGYLEETEKLPNSPKYSILLRFPLEIREKIYGYLLLYEKPIIVKADLTQVESLNLRCHAILRVCKQISDEAARFLYQRNTFRAVLRKPVVAYFTLNESFMIAPKFLSFIQNITLEGAKDNYDLGWYEKGCECVEKLGEANAVLQSLTLVVTPQKLRRAVTAMGVQSNIVTFADFLWTRGRFMRAFRILACKELRIVIKKRKAVRIPAITLNPITTMNRVEIQQKDIAVLGQAAEIVIVSRLLISLDLTYLPRDAQEFGLLRNEETIALRREEQSNVLKEMRQLKRKFENVFHSHHRALEDGICQLESEKIVVTTL